MCIYNHVAEVPTLGCGMFLSWCKSNKGHQKGSMYCHITLAEDKSCYILT